MMGSPLLIARSTSLLTCCEAFEWRDRTRTKTVLPLIASMIATAYGTPGWASRGAIQQRIPLVSRTAHAASAIALSSVE